MAMQILSGSRLPSIAEDPRYLEPVEPAMADMPAQLPDDPALPPEPVAETLMIPEVETPAKPDYSALPKPLGETYELRDKVAPAVGEIRGQATDFDQATVIGEERADADTKALDQAQTESHAALAAVKQAVAAVQRQINQLDIGAFAQKTAVGSQVKVMTEHNDSSANFVASLDSDLGVVDSLVNKLEGLHEQLATNAAAQASLQQERAEALRVSKEAKRLHVATRKRIIPDVLAKYSAAHDADEASWRQDHDLAALSRQMANLEDYNVLDKNDVPAILHLPENAEQAAELAEAEAREAKASDRYEALKRQDEELLDEQLRIEADIQESVASRDELAKQLSQKLVLHDEQIRALRTDVRQTEAEQHDNRAQLLKGYVALTALLSAVNIELPSLDLAEHVPPTDPERTAQLNSQMDALSTSHQDEPASSADGPTLVVPMHEEAPVSRL